MRIQKNRGNVVKSAGLHCCRNGERPTGIYNYLYSKYMNASSSLPLGRPELKLWLRSGHSLQEGDVPAGENPEDSENKQRSRDWIHKAGLDQLESFNPNENISDRQGAVDNEFSPL